MFEFRLSRGGRSARLSPACIFRVRLRSRDQTGQASARDAPRSARKGLIGMILCGDRTRLKAGYSSGPLSSAATVAIRKPPNGQPPPIGLCAHTIHRENFGTPLRMGKRGGENSEEKEGDRRLFSPCYCPVICDLRICHLRSCFLMTIDHLSGNGAPCFRWNSPCFSFLKKEAASPATNGELPPGSVIGLGSLSCFAANRGPCGTRECHPVRSLRTVTP